MQVHITGRQVEITDGIRDHIYAKNERTLSGFPRIEDVKVVLEAQKKINRAEVVIHGKDLHVEALDKSENLFTAIDQAFDKMERQLRKLREKVQDHREH